MSKLKKIGLILLVAQCLLNVVMVSAFLFAPALLRQNGRLSALGLALMWVAGILAISATLIFGYATQKEQTYQKASPEEPEGGTVAQRDLTLATVSFSFELLTVYIVLFH